MPVTIGIARSRALLTDQDNDGQADPGDVFLHSIIITNSGNINATNVVDAETENGLTIDPASVKIGPIAFNDAFNITGNTPITFTAAQLLGNDIDPDGPEASLVITGVSAGTNGSLVDNGNGTYTFTPSSGLDIGQTATFTYSIQDAQGLSSVAATPGVVTLTVTDVVWYVDKGASAIGQDGSFLHPFVDLASLNGAGGAGDVDSINETIFLYDRAGADVTANVILEDGQKLFGDSHVFVVNGTTVGATTSNSSIDHSGIGITLASGNTIDGIDLNGTATGAVGIQDGGATVGALTITNTNIAGSGQIVDIDQGGTLSVTLTSAASTGSSVNNGGVIDLTGITGTFTVTGAVTINGSQAQTGIDISGNNNLAVAFQGLTTVNTAANGAINLSTNTGSSNMGFTGGLDIDTTSGTGLNVNAGGTLTVTGGSNSIDTTTGQILSIATNALGASGVAFATLTASGTVASTAISLNAVTGNSFTVGTVSVAATSGGASDGINVTGSSSNVTVTTATINNTGDDGIELNGNSGSFTLNGGNIGNTNDPTDDAVNITGGTGAVTIAAVLAKTTAGNVVEVANHATGTVTFSGNLSATGAVNNGILVSGNTSGTVNFTGQTINISTGINAGVTLSSNTGATINFNPNVGGNGLDITTTTGAGFTATGGGTVTVQGSGNTITSVGGAGLNVVSTTIGASNLNFQSISANGGANGIVLNGTGAGGLTVSGTGAANSGGTIQNTTGDGIVLTNASNVSLTNFLIANTIGHGINANNLGGVNTITNSTIRDWDSSNTATKSGLNLVNLNTNMTSMTITGSTFDAGSDASTATQAGDGITMEAQGTSSMGLKVQTSTFTHQFDDAIQVAGITGSTGTVNVRILNNTFTNAIQSTPNPTPGGNPVGGGGGGVQLTPFGDLNLFAQIDTNNFTNVGENFANTGVIYGTNGLTANADITITNNTIKGVENSRGMTFTTDGSSVTKLLIQGNKLDDLGSNHAGISVNILDTANGQITINNNQIGMNGTVAGALWETGGVADAQLNNAVIVQTQNAATANVAFTNNIVSANTSSVFEVMRVRAIDTSVMNATITNNTVTDTDVAGALGGRVEIDATAGNATGGTINSTFTGNNVGAGGTINLNESGLGVLNVTQASAAAVKTANNNTGTVNADAGVTFGTATPPTPSLPTVPVSPLLAADLPPADKPSDKTGGELVPSDTGDDATNPAFGDDSSSGDPKTSSTPSNPIVDDGVLSQAELDYLKEAAIQRWADAGATPEQLAAMRATAISVADMTGLYLAVSSPGSVLVDSDAAGHNWFLDHTPGEDGEFEGSGSRLVADAGGPAEGHMDLLTALMHELGHQIGLDDLYLATHADELMYGYAVDGERRLPQADDLLGADPSQVSNGAFLLSPINIGTLPDNHAVQVTFTSTVNSFSNQVIPGFNNTSTVTFSEAGSPVTSSQEALTVDSLTLGDLVFVDTNNNGILDAGETGIAGVALTLFADTNGNNTFDSGTDVQLAVTTTAANGLYSFASLAPGNYIVRVDASNFAGGGALVGRSTATGGADPDNNVDNDDNGIAGTGIVVSQAITLSYNNEPTAGTGNDTNNTLDFGFVTLNQAPVNTVPAAQTTNEDANKVFSTGGGNAISIADADAGSGSLTVTLSVSHGTLTLNGTTGLSFGSGDGSADAAMTFTGTIANINTALNGLSYAPASNYNGADTLQIVTSDNGNTGFDPGATGGPNDEQDSDSVAITINPVNDPPSGADDTATIPINGNYVFSAADFNFSDPVEGNALDAVIIASLATNGTLRFSGAPVVVGQVITAAQLAGGSLDFLADPGESGTPYASFTFRVRDNGGGANGGVDTDQSPNTFTFNVTASAAPVVDLNGGTAGIDSAASYTEDQPAVGMAPGAVVTDADSATLSSATVSIISGFQAGTDVLLVAGSPLGLTVNYNAGTGVLTLTGVAPIADYQTVLREVAFQSTSETPGATRTISWVANDGALNSSTALTTVTITTVDDPAVAKNDAFVTNEATSVAGNLFANNGSGADSDADGPALSVSAVNGSGAGVGSQIALPSGALLTVNANGTFSWNPNGAFNTTPTPGSGASNQPANESFTYTLTAGGTATVTFTVNGLDSDDTLIGTPGVDLMNGGVGNDSLNGLGSDDSLVGGAGNDILDGGVGADQMTGGATDDTYFVDNLNDLALELTSAGNDTVRTSVSFTLGVGSEIETLAVQVPSSTETVFLNGNEFGQQLVGNDGFNRLDGRGGADVMIGFGGFDTYFVDNLNDLVLEAVNRGFDTVFTSVSYTLAGGSEVEVLAVLNPSSTETIFLTGNEFGQQLIGNDGFNRLEGRGGNDSYYVDHSNDLVIEAVGGGFDTVYSPVSYALAAGAEIEVLAALDPAGVGTLALTGNEFGQELVGNAGANILDGLGGGDVMIGFGGADTYYADFLNDLVLEAIGGGFDTVYTSVSYTLAAGSEVEMLAVRDPAGTETIFLTGNEFGQQLTGNAGFNILDGRGGADSLQGGSGVDFFQFSTALGGGNIDSIASFVSGLDKISLDDAIFAGLSLGSLNPNAFRVGATAQDADDRILYDSTTGALYFDADGNGAGAAVQFASVSAGTVLVASDFQVI